MTEEGRVGYLEDIGLEDNAALSPVLVGRNRTSESLWAMVAEARGATESSLKLVKERIDESGYLGTRVVLKSSNRGQETG